MSTPDAGLKSPEEQEESGRDELGRFVPGVSGNPHGRPKESLVSILKEELFGVAEGERVNRAIGLIKKIITQAERGDPNSQKLIFNYLEGLPQGKVDLTSGGKPIPILNVPKDDSHDEDTKAE